MSEFDKIINGILNEQVQDNKIVPKIDGTREVYAFYTLKYVNGQASDDDIQMDVIPTACLSDTNTSEWETWCEYWDQKGIDSAIDEVLYNGSSATQAYNIFISELETTNVNINKVLYEFNRIKDIVGTWKILKGMWVVVCGVEVDANAYSGAHNAIDDDISNF